MEPENNTLPDRDNRDKDHHLEDSHSGKLQELKIRWHLLLSLLILLTMLIIEYGFKYSFSSLTDLIIYLSAYLLAGYKVLYTAFRKSKELDFFNEFFLMSSATIGAFVIGSFFKFLHGEVSE